MSRLLLLCLCASTAMSQVSKDVNVNIFTYLVVCKDRLVAGPLLPPVHHRGQHDLAPAREAVRQDGLL